MNLNAKVALSLILGASTLLSACDNKENTSTQVEKAVRIPTSTEKAESAVEKSKELVAETQSAEKAEKTESADVKADTKKADVKSDAVKAEVKKETKADDVAEKVSKESAKYKQKKAVLNVLEKQYKQIRCSADAKNLSGDSFCRQEERRLFLEIQRIKDELRGIEA